MILLFLLLLWLYLRDRCHVDGCWRTGHLDPEVHAPACRRHHSHSHYQGKSRARFNLEDA